MDEFFEANRRHWDELAEIHTRPDNPFYDMASFRRGDDGLGPIVKAELGDVRGKTVLHLQCHFGMDTLRLARQGATVTGLDFSGKAIEAAKGFAQEAGLDARFVLGNVYDAPTLIEVRFDIVFVTFGALCWLPDIPTWAGIVAGFLKPGGFLYLLESHPVTFTMITDESGSLRPKYNYFASEPAVEDTDYSYSGFAQKLKNTRNYAWDHPISKVVNALIRHGLRLEFLNEHDRIPWRHFPTMLDCGDHHFSMPPGLPMAYSIKACKA